MVLDPGQCTPRHIDVIPDGGPSRGKHVLGIYRLEDDELTLCMADADQPRPREFKAEKGSRQTLMAFRRQKPSPATMSEGQASSPLRMAFRFSSGNRSMA